MTDYFKHMVRDHIMSSVWHYFESITFIITMSKLGKENANKYNNDSLLQVCPYFMNLDMSIMRHQNVYFLFSMK